MKIAVCSDLHLNNSNFGKIDERGLSFRSKDFMDAFGHVVSECITTVKPDRFVITGDVYENPNPQNPARGYFNSQMRRLSDAGIKVDVLVGNHDACSFHHALEPTDKAKIAGVRIHYEPFVEETDECLFLFFPHTDEIERKKTDFRLALLKFAGENNKRVAAAKKAGKDVIFFGHFPVFGANQNDGSRNPKTGDVTPHDLDAVMADYVLLGDYHAHQSLSLSKPCIGMYVGSLERSSFGDLESDKGYIIYDSSAQIQPGWGKLCWAPYDQGRKFIEVRGTADEVEKVVAEMNLALWKKEPVVKIVCSGSREDCRMFDSHKKGIRKTLSGAKHIICESSIIDEDRDRRVEEIRKEIAKTDHAGVEDILKLGELWVADVTNDEDERRALNAIAADIVSVVNNRQKVVGGSTGSRIRIHGVKMHNFMMYGEEKNCIEFDRGASQFLGHGGDLDDSVTAKFILPARTFADSIDMDAKRLLSIVGKMDGNERSSNGSGKTTVLEAIAYVFFGKTIREYADKPPSKGESTTSVVRTIDGVMAKECYAEVVFSAEGELWLARRGRNTTKSGSHSAVFNLLCLSSSDGSRTGHRKKDAAEVIAQLIGMDFQTCVNSVMFGTSGGDKFLNGTDKEKKDILMKILCLLIIVEYLEESRTRLKDTRTDLSALEAQVSALSDGIMDEQAKASVTTEIAELRTKESNALESAQKSEEEVSRLSDSKDLTTYESAKKEADLHSQVIAAKRSELAVGVNAAKEKVGAAEKSVAKAKETHLTCENGIKEAKSSLEQMRLAAGAFDEAGTKKTLALITEAKKAKPVREKELKEAVAALATTSADVTKSETLIDAANKDLAKFQAKLKEVQGGSTVTCPECESEMTLEHVTVKCSEKTAVLNQLVDHLGSVKKAKDTCAQSVHDLERRMENIHEYVGKEAGIATALRDHENRLERIVESETKVKSMEESLVKFAEAVSESVKELDEANKNHQAVKDTANAQMIPLIDKQNALVKASDEAAPIAEKIRQAIKEAKDLTKGFRDSAAAFVADRVKKETRLEEADRIAKAVSGKESLAEDRRRDIVRLEVIERMFGQDGIVVELIEKYMPLLNAYIAEFLDIVTKGRIITDVVTDGKRAGKVEVTVSGGVGPRPDLVSAGEKVRLILAVDMGLGMLSLTRNDSAPDFVCLDEVFAPVDEEGKELMFDVIKRLQDDFRLVVVISHDPVVQEAIKDTIVVNRVNDVSIVEKQYFED